jgi:lysophospholipase L1-like esterase
MKRFFYIVSCVVVLSGCKPELEVETPSAGDADFSRYVAVGNSLTAGYADKSLYRSGQLNSYPNILATQFRLVGGGNFQQPLLPGEFGYPDGKYVLAMKINCAGVSSLSPVYYTGIEDTSGSFQNISALGPFNNLGVPGIRAVDYLMYNYANLASSIGNADYAKRFYKDGSKRPLDELIYTMNNIKPTFFSLWLGANDVLGYATSGGEGNAPGTPLFGIILSNDISPVDIFRKNYDSVINHLVKDGAKGVLLNIPDITAIPLFTTVPQRGLKLTESEADYMNANPPVAGIQFVEGDNLFLIEDPSAPGNMRQIKTNEYIILSGDLLDSIRCGGWGKTKPIPQEDVLDAEEVTNVKNFTNSFNQIILETAQKHNLAHVDINSYLKTIVAGIKYNGVDYSTEYISGGAFSLDGVHLTPRGYAIVANEIIRVINNTYNSKIPYAEVNNYSGVRFP